MEPVYELCDPGMAVPIFYCYACLPAHLQDRARAGQLDYFAPANEPMMRVSAPEPLMAGHDGFTEVTLTKAGKKAALA